MHLELPKARLHSLKEFAKHYLMIVLSILTALGLEAWIEHRHHRQAAAEATVKIEAEIRENLAQIKHQRDHNFARMHALEKIRDGLLADLKVHASNAVINRHIHETDPEGLSLGWHWPAMSREAWDVAVANQSASWIDTDRLSRYSSIYALQNTSTTLILQDLNTLLSGPRMADAEIDMQMDDYQPRELLHVVNQMAGAVGEAARGLDILATRIDTALPSTPQSSTRMPHSG